MIPDEVATVPTLWSHQTQAVKAAVAELDGGGRCMVSMACGTGKTLVGAELSRQVAPTGRVLLVVPTLELLTQTARVYRGTLAANIGTLAAVCSDDSATVEAAEIHAELDEMRVGSSTDPATVAAWTRRRGRITVLATYASLGVLVEAQAEHGARRWDLIVVDEAHRSAGLVDRPWGVVHRDQKIRAVRRCYMTATPRLIDTTGEAAASMDDPAVFGPEVYRLPAAEAIESGLLADYRVVVATVTETELAELYSRGDVVSSGGLAVSQDMLVAQVALLKAAQEWNLRRVITYHHRVLSARRFAETLLAARDALPRRQRPKRVVADWVDGTMPPSQRRHVLARLNGSDEATTVISNARVLSEGVDVPELDAVMFADPRDSTTDVVQAVGRALRRGSRNNKTAVIIVPILLNADETPEAALDRSTWDTLWRVVRALRAHDERVADWLDQARLHYATNRQAGRDHQQELPAWLFMAGNRVDPQLLSAIKVRMLDHTTSRWIDGYAAALRFHQKHGHLNPPYLHIDEHGYPIGSWVTSRRAERRRRMLSTQRIDLLDSLGIEWEPKAAAWKQRLAEVHAYMQQHGTTPPAATPLGAWMQRQRKLRAKDELADWQVAALEAIGITDSSRSRPWQDGLAAATNYQREHGHLNCQKTETYHGFPLGQWIHNRRTEYQRGHLPSWKVEALDRLGIEWTPKSTRWQHGYNAARRFYEQHGHLQIPDRYVDPDTGHRLGKWIAWNRARARGTKTPALTPEQIRQLDAIDMIWTVRTRKQTN